MERILIIDDDPMVVGLLSECLEACGHQVLVATDGATGLELATREPVGLVLCDVVMPGLNGYDLAERLKSSPQRSDTPVVVMSGFAEEQRDTSFADEFLPKPFLLSEVLAIVNNWLRRPSAESAAA